MAKSHPVQLAPGLTLDSDADILTADTCTPLATVIAYAVRELREDVQIVQADEVSAACKMHASAWGALLALDPELAAVTVTSESMGAWLLGRVLLAAVTRTTEAPADPCALVLAVGEAARLHALATLPKNRARLRGLLAEPCTVEAAAWRPARTHRGARLGGTVPGDGHPAPAAALTDPTVGIEALQAHIDHVEGVMTREIGRRGSPPELARPTDVVLPAVRLRGGLCGPRGVLLRPGGDSALAWASAAWRISCAALEGPRKVTAPSKSGKAAALELPVVVSLDGVPVAAANLSPAGIAEALANPSPTPDPLTAERVDAFVAAATKARDEAYKVPGEEHYLAQIAAGELSEYTLTEQERTAARQLATTLTAPGADLRSPAFDRVRDDVRIALKRPQRSKYRSAYDHLVMWAESLAAEVAREDKLRTCSTRISARQNNRRAA